MKEFCEKVANVLELDSVTPDTCFRDAPMWDSLCAFGIIVMVSQQYKREISANDIKGANTVNDLARLAGVE